MHRGTTPAGHDTAEDALRPHVRADLDPGSSPPRPRNRVNRVVHAADPNRLWVVDITGGADLTGMAFTAFVSDIRSRWIDG